MSVKPYKLDDVSLIRPILILLLVVMHSFTMYAGSWKMPEGIENIRAYFWIAKFTFSFMLEMFVLISGYLFAYQTLDKNKNKKLKNLAIGKVKRLILPSIIFSIIYYFLFVNNDQSIYLSIYNIVKGMGHLWFLPMLFWCFIGGWLFMRIKMNEKLKLFLLLILVIVSFIPLPLGIGAVLGYLFYFYLGILFWKHREMIQKKLSNEKVLGILVISFLIIFVVLTLVIEKLSTIEQEQANMFIKATIISLQKFCKFVYATMGCFVMYGTANYLLNIKKIQLPQWLIKANSICFGVYIFQQFVLKILYYETSLPNLLGSYWLPVVGGIITLFVSVLLSQLMLKFKFGRYLIG